MNDGGWSEDGGTKEAVSKHSYKPGGGEVR